MKAAVGKSILSSKLRPRLSSNRASSGSRLELGDYIVADPLVCHGKPTYKGTRIMVWQVLQDLARGESVDEIAKAWDGRVTKLAVLETIRLASGAFLNADGQLARHFRGRMAA